MCRQFFLSSCLSFPPLLLRKRSPVWRGWAIEMGERQATNAISIQILFVEIRARAFALINCRAWFIIFRQMWCAAHSSDFLALDAPRVFKQVVYFKIHKKSEKKNEAREWAELHVHISSIQRAIINLWRTLRFVFMRNIQWILEPYAMPMEIAHISNKKS